MLVVRAVVDAGRHQHDGRLGDRLGREVLQRGQQVAGIVDDRQHARGLENLRKTPLHRHAVLQDVRNPRGHAQIVLQDVNLAVAVADQIRSGDVAPNAPRRVQSAADFAIALCAGQDLARHHAVVDDPLLVIHVVDEQVERADPLFQTAVQPLPFGRADDPRHQVEGKNLLRAFRRAVDVKGDSHPEQQPFGSLLPVQQIVAAKRTDFADQQLSARTRTPGRIDQFVVEACGIVALEPSGKARAAHCGRRDPFLRHCGSSSVGTPSSGGANHVVRHFPHPAGNRNPGRRSTNGPGSGVVLAQ